MGMSIIMYLSIDTVYKCIGNVGVSIYNIYTGYYNSGIHSLITQIS